MVEQAEGTVDQGLEEDMHSQWLMVNSSCSGYCFQVEDTRLLKPAKDHNCLLLAPSLCHQTGHRYREGPGWTAKSKVLSPFVVVDDKESLSIDRPLHCLLWAGIDGRRLGYCVVVVVPYFDGLLPYYEDRRSMRQARLRAQHTTGC